MVQRKKYLRLLFILFFLFLISSTAQAAMISESQEIDMGKGMHKEVLKQFPAVPDTKLQEEVNRIGKEMAAVSSRPNLPWTYTVIKDPDINAFSTMGGFVYVNQGLMDFTSDEDELAFVLGHETGHIVQRHIAYELERDFWSQLLFAVLAHNGNAAGNFCNIISIAQSRGYGFKEEHEADLVGINLMTKAGYNPYSAVVSMERMRDKFGDDGPVDLANWIKPHPKFVTRIESLKHYIEGLHFKAVPRQEPQGAAVYLGDQAVICYTLAAGSLSPWHQAELTSGALSLFLAQGGSGSQLWVCDADDASGDVLVMGQERKIARITAAEAAAQAVTPADLAAQFIRHVTNDA